MEAIERDVAELCIRRRTTWHDMREQLDGIAWLKSKLVQKLFQLDIEVNPEDDEIIGILNHLNACTHNEAIQYLGNSQNVSLHNRQALIRTFEQMDHQLNQLTKDIVTGYVRSCFANYEHQDILVIKEIHKVFPVPELHLNYYSLDKLFLYAAKIASNSGDAIEEFTKREGGKLLGNLGRLSDYQCKTIAYRLFLAGDFCPVKQWKYAAQTLMILSDIVIKWIEINGGIHGLTNAAKGKITILIDVACLVTVKFLSDFKSWEALDLIQLDHVTDEFEIFPLDYDHLIPAQYRDNFIEYLPPAGWELPKGYMSPPVPALSTLAFTILPGATIQEKHDFYVSKLNPEILTFDYFD